MHKNPSVLIVVLTTSEDALEEKQIRLHYMLPIIEATEGRVVTFLIIKNI